MLVIRGAYIRGGLYSGGLVFGILRYSIHRGDKNVETRQMNDHIQ